MPVQSRSAGRSPALCALARAIASWAALGLAGCGGAADAPYPAGARDAAAAAAPVAAAQARVWLEGCVVDAWFIPKTGTPVRAMTADGRLLGNTVSDAAGVLRLQLPPRQTVHLAIDRPDGELLAVPLGSGDLAVAACLRDLGS